MGAPSHTSGTSEEECDVEKYCRNMLQVKKNLFSKVDGNIADI